MKITLNERQARYIIQAAEWAINDDYPQSDSQNACYVRIISKLKKELGEAPDDYSYLGKEWNEEKQRWEKRA